MKEVFRKGDLISGREEIGYDTQNYRVLTKPIYGIIVSVKEDASGGKMFGVQWSHAPDRRWVARQDYLEELYKVVAFGGIRDGY